MSDIVIIPAFSRPEFLHYCLDQITKADESDTVEIVVFLDKGFDPQNINIIKQYQKKLKVHEFHQTPHQRKDGARVVNYNKLTKQSRNVMCGLISGAEASDNLVFLIEDDIFIGKDFFTMHRAIHNQ